MENDLVQRSSALLREAALKAAEDVAKEKGKDLSVLLTRFVSPVAASFLGTFSTQVVLLCLQALTNEHKSERILKHLNKLVVGPLNTGFLQLKTGLALEADAHQDTPEQTIHRISRYRDALCSFDEALGLADEDERPAIHLYRAFVSTKIPGAEKEARSHFSEFAAACRGLARDLIQKSEIEDAAATRLESSAAEIAADRGMGGGAVSLA